MGTEERLKELEAAVAGQEKRLNMVEVQLTLVRWLATALAIAGLSLGVGLIAEVFK